MKYFKYLVTLVTAISILGSLSKDVKGFVKGFKPDFLQEEQLEPTGEEVVVDKDELNLTGTYEYKSTLSNKNKYLEFKEGYVYYYGNSSDFSATKEQDSLGYFFTQVSDLVLEQDTIGFKVEVNNSMFYKYQISPLFRTEHNENVKVHLRSKQQLYRGVLNKEKDTLTVNSEGFPSRFFVRISN